MNEVLVETRGAVRIITINQPHVRNAVDAQTARGLYEAFTGFDADPDVSVAVLTGAEGTFCAGANLKAIAETEGNPVRSEAPDTITSTQGPMGPTRLQLTKPTIAAVEGFAVAGNFAFAGPAGLPMDDHTNIQRWLAAMDEIPAWKAAEPPAMGA